MQLDKLLQRYGSSADAVEERGAKRRVVVTPVGAAAADGLGLVLIPTSDWGTTGDGPGFTAEEPNVPGSLGFGIDASKERSTWVDRGLDVVVAGSVMLGYGAPASTP